MQRFLKVIWVLLFILAFFTLPQAVQAESSAYAPSFSSASDLIAGVNTLRATYGLAPYKTNSILMSIAQTHAEYMAAIGVSNAHTDAQGLLPYQRAISAGYLVGGDLSLGGYFSENVTGGIGKTAQQAIDEWLGDLPHKTTMLSGTLADVGVGVAVVGNTYYYCLDVGLSTGGTPVAYTPPAQLYQPSTPTIVPNTPNADGSIVHIVQPGETLGSLSMAYNVPLTDILNLNGLTVKSTIFVNQKIIIRAVNTPTATQPTSTPTIPPSMTPWPTSTPTSTATDLPPTPTPSSGLSASAAGAAVAAIMVSALILAGLIAFLGRKRR